MKHRRPASLYILGLADAGATVGWDVVDQRGPQILRVLEFAPALCALALAAAAFVDRRILAVAGVVLLVVHYFAQQWWEDAFSERLLEVVRGGEGTTVGLTAGGVAVSAVHAAGLLLLIVTVVRGGQVPVEDQEVARSRE